MRDTGTQVGSYTLGDRLGAGGMGVVYEACMAGQTFAIKMLYADSTSDELAVDRFRDEARAGTAVNHPSVVSVLDHGETEEGYPYLVMERVAGESLSARIARRELGIEDAVTIAIQLLDGLEAIHAAGLVHCDVKSDNVLVAQAAGRPVAKLIDLGLARSAGDPDADEGMISGTPLYMAPEVIRGEVARPASDLYALGVLLYEALTGRTPFVGTGATQLFQCHLEDWPAAPSTWRPCAIPPALDAIVLRALEKAPEDRFPTAAAFAAALAAALPALSEHEHERHAPASRFEPTIAWSDFAIGTTQRSRRGHQRSPEQAATREVARERDERR